MTGSVPAFSIVVASFRPGPVLFECLAALEVQDRTGVEVLLVDGSADRTADDVRTRFPWVRIVDAGSAQSLPRLRGLGMASTMALVVGVLDAWCIVSLDWIAEVQRIHRMRPELVVGGGVDLHPSERNSTRAWATYLFDYWEFVAPFPEGFVRVLPGNNITYKRSALPDAETLRTSGFWKSFTNARLKEAGQLLVASNGLRVRLRRHMPLGRFLRSRFHHGRSYAAMRVQESPWVARWRFALVTPGLPVLFIARQARGLAAKRGARAWFVICLPLLVMFHLSWSFGELCGYLLGPGRSHDAIRS